MRCSVTALVCAFVAFAPPQAGAQTSRSVSLLFGACEAASGIPGLDRQLRIELESAGIAVTDAGVPGVTSVSIIPPGCHEGAGVLVIMHDESRSITRLLDWTGAEAPDAVRVTALTIVELLRELEQPIEPIVTERVATHAELELVRRELEVLDTELHRAVDSRAMELRREIEDTRLREDAERHALGIWELGLEAVFASYLESNIALLGPGIRGAYTLLDPLRLSAAVDLGWGLVRDVLGDIHWMSARGTLGLEARMRSRPFEGFATLWGSFGWSQARGDARDVARVEARTLEDFMGAFGLGAGAVIELEDAWLITLRVDVGYGYAGLVVFSDERPIGATRGILLGVTLGVAWAE